MTRADSGSLDEFVDRDDVRGYINQTRNWGRWGPDDQRGTLNHISGDSRVRAARLVRAGIAVSLSRPIVPEREADNPRSAQLRISLNDRGNGAGSAVDYLGIHCHGTATTHIDALGHIWDTDGQLYNGVPYASALGANGLGWCALDQLSSGIFTRGVLLDVARARGESYVTPGQPVTAGELQRIVDVAGIDLQPGDAIAIHCGREKWNLEHPAWGSEPQRPGLDVSCLKFLRENDCSALVWDMTDSKPVRYGLSHGVHAAVPAYGLIIVDSARLDELVTVCADHHRTDFLLTVNPLVIPKATGCAVNPIAII